MKTKQLAWIMVLGIVLLFGACGKPDQKPAPAAAASQGETAEEPTTPAAARTGLRTISDMANAWNTLYNKNEKAINDYEGMPIMGLVTPPLAFAAAVQFDIMNPNNRDGRFEGKLMLAGRPGFLEKAGAKLVFGYEDKLAKDGFGPMNKAGDRLHGSGSLDLDAGYFNWETFNEREGRKIQREYTEFKRLDDGSMICLALSGQAFNMRGGEEMRSTAIYLHNGPGRYDFIVARGQAGPGFPVLSFAAQGDLAKAQATELFQAAGYEIEKSGGIQGGVLVLDK